MKNGQSEELIDYLSKCTIDDLIRAIKEINIQEIKKYEQKKYYFVYKNFKYPFKKVVKNLIKNQMKLINANYTTYQMQNAIIKTFSKQTLNKAGISLIINEKFENKHI